MNAIDVKIGETFSVNGETFEKTRDGFKRLSDGTIVSEVTGDVIIEKRIING